jgi:hypothetical protein
MPMIVPLLAAGASVGLGMMATGVVGGMMIAGGVLSGVGALTGNKRLSQFGGLLSLAGGVAGMASGAWKTASTTIADQAAKEGAGAYTGVADAAGSAAQGSSALAGISDANAGAASLESSASAFASPDSLAAQGAPSWQPGNGSLSANAPTAAPSTIPADVPLAGQGASTGSVNGPFTPKPLDATSTLGNNPSNALPTTNPAVPVNGPGGVPPGGSPGLLGSIGDKLKAGIQWAQEGNGTNARLVQAGSGLLSAGMGAIGQQEAIKTQIKLQEEALARMRARLSSSIKGVAMPTFQAPRNVIQIPKG